MCGLHVILQILQISPQKFHFFHVFFVCVSSNFLWSETFSHKNCTFFFMCFLYVFLQIAYGPKYFPTKIAIFSSCVFCMCFFKLPLVRNIFPQKSQFLLHVFLVCVSSNCLWSQIFSHKNCTFFFMCFLYMFLQIAFGPKHFLHVFFYVILQIAYGLKNFPSKVALFSSCVFVCVSSNCLRPGNFSHRVCT